VAIAERRVISVDLPARRRHRDAGLGGRVLFDVTGLCSLGFVVHFNPDTVDAALDEVIKLQQRGRLVELLFTPGRLQLDDPEVMAGAWR
jgi:hypothetical protein